MTEWFGELLTKLIPWILPALLVASFISNHTVISGKSESSSKKEKGEKASQPKEEPVTKE